MPAEKKYFEILDKLKVRIRQARLKAAFSANAQMLAMYWEIGNTILQQQKNRVGVRKLLTAYLPILKYLFPK